MKNNSNLSKRQLWQLHVEDWKSSGKTMGQWCKEHNICRSTFAYWKEKFSCESLEKSSFIEIAEIPTSTGIAIKCKEFELHIEHSFNEIALSRCLKVMRSVLC